MAERLTHTPPTDLDQGVADGIEHARRYLADRARLGRIVRAHSAAEVVAELGTSPRKADGTMGSTAYWSGFAHGVQRVIRDTSDDAIPDS